MNEALEILNSFRAGSLQKESRARIEESMKRLELLVSAGLPAELKKAASYLQARHRKGHSISPEDPALKTYYDPIDALGLPDSNEALGKSLEKAFDESTAETLKGLTPAEKLEFWSGAASSVYSMKTPFSLPLQLQEELRAQNQFSKFIGFLGVRAIDRLKEFENTSKAYQAISLLVGTNVLSSDERMPSEEAQAALRTPADAKAARAGVQAARKELAKTIRKSSPSLHSHLAAQTALKILDNLNADSCRPTLLGGWLRRFRRHY